MTDLTEQVSAQMADAYRQGAIAALDNATEALTRDDELCPECAATIAAYLAVFAMEVNVTREIRDD